MEKINILAGILLKLVVAICIAFATFYYCYNAGNNRYKPINDNNRLGINFDGKTGDMGL
jgi:hypothetical protein